MVQQLSIFNSENVPHVDPITRNRETLKHFIDSAKLSLPGGKAYLYTQAIRGKEKAEDERVKSFERLKRACKRADVDFQQVCAEHHLYVH